MTVEEYKAAIEAGLVTQEQQDAVNAAVEAAMQAEIDARMQREEIRSADQPGYTTDGWGTNAE